MSKGIIDFLNNGYVTNIICGIITVLLIYYYQLVRSKYKIKKDFRCMEIIDELYFAIYKSDQLAQSRMKLKRNIENKINIKKGNKNFCSEDEYNMKNQEYQAFFNENKHDLEFIMMFLTHHNNHILLDSIQSVFFININFKLLGIINHIKNRIPNVEKCYSDLEKYANYDWHLIDIMLSDVIFLSQYYKELYTYLGCDLLYHQARQIANKEFENVNIIEIINGPIDIQKKFNKDYKKKVKTEYKKLKKKK